MLFTAPKIFYVIACPVKQTIQASALMMLIQGGVCLRFLPV